MPFTTTLQLDPNPPVRIFFSGLTVIKPTADATTCEVFIHRIALDHVPSIEIRVKRPNARDIILMRQVAPFEFAAPNPPNPVAQHCLLITTNAARGIRGYEGADTAEGRSLHAAIDLNNLHRGKTAVDAPSGRPSIFLNDAVFYAADITPPGLEVELRRNGPVRDLTPFASLIGANIYDNLITVEWRLNGHLQTMRLTPLANGYSYEIYVINDPPYQPPPPAGTQPHDELQEYYKLLPNVPHQERYSMFFRKIPGDNALSEKMGDRGSSRTPCMSVIDNS